MPEIWSYGHRNPQGAALDAQGTLWAVEHGAQGGDEINRIRKGANYGWPVIAYGRHYSGAKIGEGSAKPGMEQPAFYWDPSIAPSGMAIYSGRLWPDWQGDMFVGSLKFDFIARLEGTPLREVERIETEQTLRVRDVSEAPDGAIWFVSEGNGAVYRMTSRLRPLRSTAAPRGCRARGRGWCRNAPGSISRNATGEAKPQASATLITLMSVCISRLRAFCRRSSM